MSLYQKGAIWYKSEVWNVVFLWFLKRCYDVQFCKVSLHNVRLFFVFLNGMGVKLFKNIIISFKNYSDIFI